MTQNEKHRLLAVAALVIEGEQNAREHDPCGKSWESIDSHLTAKSKKAIEGIAEGIRGKWEILQELDVEFRVGR